MKIYKRICTSIVDNYEERLYVVTSIRGWLYAAVPGVPDLDLHQCQRDLGADRLSGALPHRRHRPGACRYERPTRFS